MNAENKDETLSERFVAAQLAEHKEPERRGDGFPTAKAKAAALLATTQRRTADVAAEIGTSGYVVRNWLGEDAFRMQMARDVRDSVSFFVEHADKVLEGQETLPVKGEPLGRLAEATVSDEVIRRAQTDNPKWLLVAARQLAPIREAKRQAPEDNRWTKQRAERIQRGIREHSEDATLMILASDRPTEELTVEAALQAIRHRFHGEIEKLLPATATELDRELLGYLCGCTGHPKPT